MSALLELRDLAWWMEAECYNLKRLEEIGQPAGMKNGGQQTVIYSGQIAPIRERLWRIHELLERAVVLGLTVS